MGPSAVTDELDARAAEAERSVTSLFGARLLGLPFTHLARVTFPPSRGRGPWHYWWQAHYLDALVDAAERHLRRDDPAAARQQAKRGNRLLATVRLRNQGRFTNTYYDDMAWLALAVQRLDSLGEALHWVGPRRRRRAAHRALVGRLRSAISTDLGGGLFWNTTRDFKNVPATAPYALYLARAGETTPARRLLDWVYDRLLDAESGLVADGVRVVDGAEQLVPDIWTYNQGTVLGALLSLGDARCLARASDLISAVDQHLTTSINDLRPLRTHGGGDGGLFTGILARYLALAATHTGLDDTARATSARLVLDTGEALWAGRDARGADLDGATVFSPDPTGPARDSQPTGAPVELSTQLQAWTVLEAASVGRIEERSRG